MNTKRRTNRKSRPASIRLTPNLTRNVEALSRRTGWSVARVVNSLVNIAGTAMMGEFADAKGLNEEIRKAATIREIKAQAAAKIRNLNPRIKPTAVSVDAKKKKAA